MLREPISENMGMWGQWGRSFFVNLVRESACYRLETFMRITGER